MIEVLNKISELTGKKYVKLCQSGDHAIKHVLELAKKLQKDKLIMQDQGGWLTYKSYARKNGLNIIELKTNYGIINPEELENKITSNSVLLVNSLTGYFAEQPMEEIMQKCKEKHCLLINDISGSVMTENGKRGNILICSCGTYKPINAGYGGFIATNDEELFALIENTFFDEKMLNQLKLELERLPKRLEYFWKLSEKIKKELKNYEIIHKESKGINVIVKFKNDEEKNDIIKYCEKNKLPFTTCPRYIRVLENAVCIEVKKLAYEIK